MFSTLHTNDAPAAITRLLDLGVPAYLIQSTLLGVLAQRLVRTLCPHCKEPASLDEESWGWLTAPWKAAKPAQVQKPVGCLECRMTGYLGRMGIYETLVMSQNLKALVTAECDAAQLRELAYREGMKPLRISGAMKVASGITTVEEVLKVALPATEDRRRKVLMWGSTRAGRAFCFPDFPVMMRNFSGCSLSTHAAGGVRIVRAAAPLSLASLLLAAVAAVPIAVYFHRHLDKPMLLGILGLITLLFGLLFLIANRTAQGLRQVEERYALATGASDGIGIGIQPPGRSTTSPRFLALLGYAAGHIDDIYMWRSWCIRMTPSRPTRDLIAHQRLTDQRE